MRAKPIQATESSLQMGERGAMAMGADETGKAEEGARRPRVKTSARLQAKRQRQGEQESKDDCYLYCYSPSEEDEEASQASGHGDASDYEPALGEDDGPADSDDEE
eukprot:jgi/Picsp_1/4784/NSC_02152-R1_---NA---